MQVIMIIRISFDILLNINVSENGKITLAIPITSAMNVAMLCFITTISVVQSNLGNFKFTMIPIIEIKIE